MLSIVAHSKHTLRGEKEGDMLMDLSLTLTRSERKTKLTLWVRNGHESLNDSALGLFLQLCRCLCCCSAHCSFLLLLF